ncbi:MAG: aspartate aminotransferase family protein [Longimicrobiaceae bacterium]
MTDYPFGPALPEVGAPLPGPRSRALAEALGRVESPNVTHLADDFPVFWSEARGANVRDVDGNVYLDLTAGFAVAGVGHAHPHVVAAIREQAGRLLHGMGDVHPPELKVRLLEALAAVTPGDLGVTVLTSSGAEAVEVALKTAYLKTGKPRVLAFAGGYHGLTYGALAVSGRDWFRAPFEAQLPVTAVLAPYPEPYGFQGSPEECLAGSLREVERLLDEHADVGAVLAEPVQGRGGVLVPPDGFLRELSRVCDRRGLLLILDEVYTGFGRTGRWFACEHEGVVPDLLLVGKALTGGLPMAACIGTPGAMDCWPRSSGEALHTSTFLGNPVTCAAALASISVLQGESLVARSARLGKRALEQLDGRLAGHPRVAEVRGRGMMIGLELLRDRESREPDAALARTVMVEALRRGVIVLAGGVHGNVISLSPPFTISGEQLDHGIGVIVGVLDSRR